MRATFRAAAVSGIALCLLIGCDECRDYSAHSCSELSKATYNVHFYYPSGRAEYLGVAEGLSSCGAVAHNFARSKELNQNNDWSYICCLKTSSSECAEKHR